MKKIMMFLLIISFLGCTTLADFNKNGELDKEEKAAIAIFTIEQVVIWTITGIGILIHFEINPKKAAVH